jgi:hypothetical protein
MLYIISQYKQLFMGFVMFGLETAGANNEVKKDTLNLNELFKEFKEANKGFNSNNKEGVKKMQTVLNKF